MNLSFINLNVHIKIKQFLLATYLREGNEDWDGKEINESVQVLVVEMEKWKTQH